MKLRDYQEQGVTDIETEWRLHRRLIWVSPTGTGKAVLIARVARRLLRVGKRVLILVHTREILRHVRDCLIADGIGAKSVGIVWARNEGRPEAPIQLASVQTIQHRDLPDVDAVILDEAHHAPSPQIARMLGHYHKAKILGVTATPARLGGGALSDCFDLMVNGPTVDWCIEHGFLARPDVWTTPVAHAGIVEIRASLKVAGGDYGRGITGKRMSRRKLVGDAVAHWMRLAEGRPTVCFAASVAHGTVIMKAFRRKKVRAVLLTGKTPDVDRLALVGKGGSLETGGVQVVVTCDAISEGWDLPAARCAILARPTMSLVKHLQQCGRVMRPGPVTPLILDHAGNVGFHGSPDLPQPWSLDVAMKRGAGGAHVEFDAEWRAVRRDPETVAGELVRAAKASRSLRECPVKGPGCAGLVSKTAYRRGVDAGRQASCYACFAPSRSVPNECAVKGPRCRGAVTHKAKLTAFREGRPVRCRACLDASRGTISQPCGICAGHVDARSQVIQRREGRAIECLRCYRVRVSTPCAACADCGAKLSKGATILGQKTGTDRRCRPCNVKALYASARIPWPTCQSCGAEIRSHSKRADVAQGKDVMLRCGACYRARGVSAEKTSLRPQGRMALN